MKSNPTRFWWSMIALGWALDFLFWRQRLGVNFALYALLCLVTGFLLLRSDGHRPARSVWLLIPLIVFFAALTFLRQEPMTAFLAVVMTLFLMSIAAASYLGGRWTSYSLLDYLGKFLQLLGSMAFRPLTFHVEAREVLAKREQAEAEPRSGTRRGTSQTWAIVRGLLLALPILAIFTALLASADLVFSQRVEAFLELFDLKKLPQYIFRLGYILIAAYLLAGVFLHAATRSQDEKLAGQDKAMLPPFLGFTEAVIVLGSVALLFAAFVVVQFQYFFGGQANIHIEGYTYSEYARRGFGELILVAFFSLLLILGASSVTRREKETQRRIFSGLEVGIVGLVLVMLVSAFQRLVLYETAYGFSRLRTYPHIFMVWLGLLLVATAALEIVRRERAFALAAVLASLGFAVSLGVMNVDGFIVRQNVNRALVSEEIDADYLMQLSDDAVPALATAYRTQPLSASVKEGIGAALACYAARHRTDAPPASWRSFHLARWNADRILADLRAELQAYEMEGDEWSRKVIAPSGEEYFCNWYWD
ncbi:MAG: hypothetical protein Fur0043_20710 [Anaerolineales bacterium]